MLPRLVSFVVYSLHYITQYGRLYTTNCEINKANGSNRCLFPRILQRNITGVIRTLHLLPECRAIFYLVLYLTHFTDIPSIPLSLNSTRLQVEHHRIAYPSLKTQRGLSFLIKTCTQA